MADREYIVTVNPGTDLAALDAEMVSALGSDTIPTRKVTIANPREASRVSTHFMLSDAEAEDLRNDDRVLAVEIPVEERDDVQISLRASQAGTFFRGSGSAGNLDNWALKRCQSLTENYGNGSTPSGEQTITSITDPYLYPLDGTGVDVVIQDSGIEGGHPEWETLNFVAPDHYAAGPLVTDSTNGAVFDRSINVHGLKIVIAGAVGGATTVHSEFAKKVARTVELLLTPRKTTNTEKQKKLIENLRGDTGTWHAGTPAAQRIGYGGGANYSPNWLTDSGISSYSGYQGFLDSHAVNDMVWYQSGSTPGTGNDDITEVIEHVFHTIHQYGLEARELKMFPSFDSDWATGPMFLAMKEAEDNNIWDAASSGAPNWKTDADTFPVAVKEYLYLLNFAMFEYTSLWDGGSLAPEWVDAARTPAGIQALNPLGYGLFNTHIKDVIEKIDIDVLQSIFPDGDIGNPFVAGSSGYVSNTSSSRLQQIDWYKESTVTGTQDTTFYTDLHGHGTHCTGTVAGKTFGWAKGARIYSQKLGGLEGSADPDNGISIVNSFDCIRSWHNKKPIDPITKVKRPTIVNMSWGYGTNIANTETPVSGNYRGAAWTYGTDYATIQQVWANVGVVPYVGTRWKIPVQVAYVDAEVADMINDGIHVCIAAGNDYYKVDVAAGADYNNTVTFTAGTYNYHRPPSPYATGAFNVGNIDSRILNNQDVTKPDSMKGPAVTVWAPGTNIISACSNTSEIGGPAAYKLDGSWGQQSISGTSMASPQVCGVGALNLQVDPTLTPAQLKQKLEGNAPATMYTTSSSTDYNAYTTSIMGSAGKILYNKYNSDQPFATSGGVTITNLRIV